MYCSSHWKKTLGKIPQKVAEYLNLPNSTLYTGHCFRRTSASLLADSGASIDVLKRHGGWKSASVAEGYIENSINTKKIVADSIFGLGVGNSTDSASAHQVSGSAVSASSASSTSSKNNIVQNTIDGANRLLNIVNCTLTESDSLGCYIENKEVHVNFRCRRHGQSIVFYSHIMAAIHSDDLHHSPTAHHYMLIE
ncbi:hypothetical protein NQ315_005768 [Exocentrus adspersus]|uniref:Tyr recombinase domain-containing protein n=1 Tax=Exocentrus adspersus TaxID=1586481 RepID=A0AAV8V7I4_9CUCU|nr:hypothetical protein NQ315_005768 [Exocentrus adspersus]